MVTNSAREAKLSTSYSQTFAVQTVAFLLRPDFVLCVSAFWAVKMLQLGTNPHIVLNAAADGFIENVIETNFLN